MLILFFLDNNIRSESSYRSTRIIAIWSRYYWYLTHTWFPRFLDPIDRFFLRESERMSRSDVSPRESNTLKRHGGVKFQSSIEKTCIQWRILFFKSYFSFVIICFISFFNYSCLLPSVFLRRFFIKGFMSFLIAFLLDYESNNGKFYHFKENRV